MKKITTGICTALAVLLVGATGAVTPNAAAADTSAENSVTCSVKTYIPDMYDLVDYYQASGNISQTEALGFTTFAHVGLVTPLQGTNIQMDTQFMLLSKTSTDNGGDGIDGWVTYSFSATPAVEGNDKTYPYYGGTTSGYFLHITNYSSTTAPNCVEVQVVKNVDGVTDGNMVTSFFLDNAQNIPITLTLIKGEDDLYDLTFKNRGTETVLKTVNDLALDESLFINELGQTFFSTAIYEAEGCDGNHHAHRGVSVASMQAYTQDITAANVTLDKASYEVSESGVRPTTTVTLGDKTLSAGLDYDVAYENNTAVGTGKAILTFYGTYGGNVVEKEFTIVEATESDETGDVSNSGSGETGDVSDETSDETSDVTDAPVDDGAAVGGGCFSTVGLGSGILALFTLGGSVALMRRKRK